MSAAIDIAGTHADIAAAREAAVSATRARIRAIEGAQGVTRASLDEIKAAMLELAGHEALFPSAEFPPPPEGEAGARRYLLQEDPDGRFAMYLLALNPGNASKPHDHTTWAVVVSVEGPEHNRVYRRVDDGSVPGRCELEIAREVVVEPGTGIALMPEDIHSIHTVGDRSTRHLHVYGLALERLDDRLAYDPENGVVKPYNKAFMQPTVNR
jgi:predicted metal-dependent enzyme (double-stranded beta helix superfamily)